jgi:hypothetical protein
MTRSVPKMIVLPGILPLLGCTFLAHPAPTPESAPVGKAPDRAAFEWELQQTISDFDRQLSEVSEIVDTLDPETRQQVIPRLARITRLQERLREAAELLTVSPEDGWESAAPEVNALIREIEDEFEHVGALLGPAPLQATQVIGPRCW